MINNEFYKKLGNQWFESKGDAVALLRLEGRLKTPWVLGQLSDLPPGRPILDVGCGGGDLALALAEQGMVCTAVDVEDSILNVGRGRDLQNKVTWILGQALDLPIATSSQDAVCIMDVLEHVDDPRRAVAECVRVLKPGGKFLFHTFNRTFLAWLFAAKGLDWFIKNSPQNVHDWKMFIKPDEMVGWLSELGMHGVSLTGIGPKVNSKAFAKLVFTRTVSEDFEFKLGPSLQVGYLGAATK